MSFFVSCNSLYFKVILSDIIIAPPTFFCFPSSRNTFFHPLTFSLFVSLDLKWVSCRHDIYDSCTYIYIHIYIYKPLPSPLYIATPPTPAGDPSILAGKSSPVFYEITSFFSWPWYARDPVCTFQKWILCFPRFCGISAVKLHWPSKLDSLGVLPPIARPTQAGEADVTASELSLLWENFWGTIIFLFVGSLPSVYGI